MKISFKMSGFIFGLLLPMLFSPISFAAPEISSRPIIFVHGFNPFGLPEDCRHDYAKMEGALAAKGFTGKMSTIAYYFDDTHCDVNVTPHGSILTPIPDISKDLAWYIYNTYSSKGVSIDIVAHSMGGLVVRYALYRVAVADPKFPPFLIVPHVATMAVPYVGYSLLAELCHVNIANFQCDEMFPFSPFIEGLKAPLALVPQTQGGTVWSNIGSKAVIIDGSDGFVQSSSATSMNISANAKASMPWHMLIFHSDYTHNNTVIGLIGNSLGGATGEFGNIGAMIESNATLTTSDALETSDVSPITLSRAEVFFDFDQLPQEQRPAQIEPYAENDQSLGVQFTNVLPGGLFAKMGIQNDDNVRGCSSATVNAPFAALTALETSTNAFNLKLCIYRNGSKITQNITIQ